jgi:hypothetical protein
MCYYQGDKINEKVWTVREKGTELKNAHRKFLIKLEQKRIFWNARHGWV